MMGKKPCCWFLFLWFIFSSFVAASRKQAELFSLLQKAKIQGNSGIDTSPFEVNYEIEYGNENFKILPQKGMKEKDRIERLPGQPEVEFNQYGGYVTIDESKGEALYYYFVEAPSSKESLPLLLWLNGGPGCSSLGGAMEELGPFWVHSDGKTLYRNRFAWNKAANVLFLETPSGVGFSYSNVTYNDRGDRKTAGGNYAFLLNWLERFPEYKKRDFYLAGESYAGHFVPQLAHVIFHHNNKANVTIINLKGIAIGNAAIHDETDWLGMYQYFGSHAIVGERTIRQIEKHCDFSPGVITRQSNKCNAALDEVDPDIANLDIYNIYAQMCLDSNLTAKPKKVTPLQSDPCSDNYVHAYLNRPDVQEALHANVTKLKYDWEICNNVVYNWTDSPWSIISLLREFMENGLRVWVYSGDVDGRVPVTSTLASLAKMMLTVKTPWHPWFHAGEVGGYMEVYKGEMTFATVRGAGHMVPTFQPSRALSLITHFLTGTPLPNNNPK